jgi:hypothetical protein
MLAIINTRLASKEFSEDPSGGLTGLSRMALKAGLKVRAFLADRRETAMVRANCW